jgi:hypothetical protein
MAVLRKMAVEAIHMRNTLTVLLTKFRAMSKLRCSLLLAVAGVVCLLLPVQSRDSRVGK